MARAITRQNESEYSKMLLKNIPTEIIGCYVSINGLLSANPENPNWLGWVIFGVLLILTPIWLRFGQEVKQFWQLALSTGAFIVWAMTMPGAFDVVPYAASIGGALVIIYSGVVAPMVSKNRPKQA